MRHALRAIFDLLPDFAGIFLAAVGIAIVFAGELVKWFEAKKIVRWALVLVLILVGAGGVISNSVQKNEERAEADRDRRELTRQIGILISSSQIQATGDDMRRLSDTVSSGFSRLEKVFGGSKLSHQVEQKPLLPPPTVEHVRWIQRRAPSDNPKAPMACR